MRHLLKLALPSESAWQTMRAAHFSGPGVEVVILGTLYRETGAMVTVAGPGGDMQVPERVATNGLYHVDLIAPDVPEAVYAYLVNPVVTKHVWAGNEVLAMPETLVEAETTEMVTRGIGQAIPDDVLARLDRAVLMGRITPEMAADRRAWHEAGIAITEQREAIGEARMRRDAAIQAARAADAERDVLLAQRQAAVAERDAQDAARVAAVALAQTTTGAARQAAIAARDAAVAARDAASAEILRIDPLLAGQVAALAAAVDARDEASDEMDAGLVAVTAARAARAEAKAALQ